MGTTSKTIIETLVTGGPEGGSARSRYEQTNSTGVRISQETTFGAGIASATTFAVPVTNAKGLTIVMPTTNESGWRLALSTSEVGLPMASQGASHFSFQESTTPTTFYAYSTSTRAISGVRLVWS